MPTNRKRKTRKLKSVITDSVRHYLETGEADEKDIEVYLLSGNPEALREKWEILKDDIMAAWLLSHPGSRPFSWWTFEAPEPRPRIGGNGQTTNDRYPATMAVYDKGIPSSWHCIEPNDPPTFESQAAYLDRHGLLSATEKKTLKPSDFKPVKIEV